MRLFRIFFILLLFIVVFIFFKKETRFWNGSDKLSIVENYGGDALVATFDPKGASITEILIPGDTQVEVARNLGVFRLKSVWQLGLNEKVGGALLAATVAKNFDFPVYIWADGEASGFSRGDFKSLLVATTSFYKTNLGVGDKIRLFLFTLGVKNLNRSEVDLRDTSFVKKTRLVGGESGYIVAGNIPERLVATFSDNETGNLSLKTLIRDSTGSQNEAKTVGEIVGVLGPKIAAVAKEESNVNACEVSGKYKNLIIKVARIFNCRVGRATSQNFDLEILLDKNFPKRF